MAQKIKNSTDRPNFPRFTLAEGAKSYADLNRKMTSLRIFDRSYIYYSILITCIIGGFLFSAYNLYLHQSAWLLIIWSMAFAFSTVQIGGLLHDAGHRAIFTSSKMNDTFGHFFSGLVVMGYGNWKIKHNLHHAHPNQEDEDPDITIPFSFTEDQYRGRTGIVGLIRKYQAYFYYPFGSLVWITMRLKGLEYFKDKFKLRTIWEIAIFATGFFIWFILPFFVFEFPKALLVFAVVNPATGFYMFNIFAPNHKGMPQLAKGIKLSFVEQQIITSRNVTGNWFNDFIYMGLNYQIEHHLFPSTPRNKLHLLSPYVQEFCQQHGFEYTQAGPIHSNRIILAELHQIAS